MPPSVPTESVCRTEIRANGIFDRAKEPCVISEYWVYSISICSSHSKQSNSICRMMCIPLRKVHIFSWHSFIHSSGARAKEGAHMCKIRMMRAYKMWMNVCVADFIHRNLCFFLVPLYNYLTHGVRVTETHAHSFGELWFPRGAYYKHTAAFFFLHFFHFFFQPFYHCDLFFFPLTTENDTDNKITGQRKYVYDTLIMGRKTTK